MATDQYSDDGRYQGWANHATWCVNLHLTNDQDMYNHARELALSASDTSDDGEVAGLALVNAADALKDYVESICFGDDGELVEEANEIGLAGLLIQDLLQGYLCDVNWREIAEALREV